MRIKRFALGQMVANCYVVFDEETRVGVIIDPGEFSQLVCNYVLKNGINVKYILLTHGHFDHVCGAADFAGRYKADIVIGSKESTMLDRLNSDFGSFEDIDKITETVTVNDGDTLKAGGLDIKCIATPGHTAGGMCYCINGFVFSGDTLFCASVGRSDFYSGDFDELKKSIRHLYSLFPDDTVVYPGHGFSTTVGSEKHGNPYVKEK